MSKPDPQTPPRLFSAIVRVRALKAYEKQVNGKEYDHDRSDGGRGVSNAMIGKGGEPDENTRYHYWVVSLDEPFLPYVEAHVKPFDHGGRKWIIFPM